MSQAAQTSIEAYQEIIDSGELNRQQEAVFKVIRKEGPVSRNDLDRMLGFRRSSICGRVRELIDAGLVEVTGVEPDPESGKRVELLEVVA